MILESWSTYAGERQKIRNFAWYDDPKEGRPDAWFLVPYDRAAMRQALRMKALQKDNQDLGPTPERNVAILMGPWKLTNRKHSGEKPMNYPLVN